MLGLPDHVHACLFDLDGVLTRTASLHAAAWKRTFDEFLARRAEELGVPFVPFDRVHDYDEYVDGRPRDDGIRTFLAARGIEVPEGAGQDPPGADTVRGLGARKNRLLLAGIRDEGVETFGSSIRYVRAVKEAGLPRAVVSSSTNCREVLVSAGIEDLFDVRIDGRTAQARKLRGKPAPDGYLAGAAALRTEPGRAAVFEDALAGVEAGRAGGFGWVVGVDRVGQGEALREHGADIVVQDLGDLWRQS
ncbi:HAD family hydrolase [Streptomyces sp. TR06-5]|uniref:HAD family hydrolase n=1 Tax=Streptomyces sp. TR06-5 TaxID=3385976 RepID=UPI0039A24C0D